MKFSLKLIPNIMQRIESLKYTNKTSSHCHAYCERQSPEMKTGAKFHKYNRDGAVAHVKEKYQDSVYVPS